MYGYLCMVTYVWLLMYGKEKLNAYVRPIGRTTCVSMDIHIEVQGVNRYIYFQTSYT